MIDSHDKSFARYGLRERLAQVDLSLSAYNRLKDRVRDRAARESVVMEDEVEAVVGIIVRHPNLGAGKLRSTLIDREEAVVGSGFINEAKQAIAEESETAYRTRRETGKTLQAALRERMQPAANYRHIRAEYPHHIWAIDFVFLRFLGFRFALAVVYDIFSQAYLGIEAGMGCTDALAHRALDRAAANAGRRACRFLRRDNGKAFLAASVQELLANLRIEDRPIPPGSPWFNGSLESNNGSLKTTVKTLAMQTMARTPQLFASVGKETHAACALLQKICDRTRDVLNRKISRQKFDMPPQQVLDDKVSETRQRHERFIRRKRADRRKRMERLRRQTERKDDSKTFLDKVRLKFSQALRAMSTDELYVLNEIIHGRYKAIEA
jgi:transposase InsO family protein